ncbi:spermidine N1-acetyltransferase [Escherichia coli]|uniref:Spermidine N1-acetyltransferase n=1 Tax=Escherichia coli TaxID=562 RepID=A0A377D5W8_ECOLX|nr:spermidine N1-acetyltransferase [Escherichia coli]
MRYWLRNPTKPLLNSLICTISIFTIRANGALWWECDGEKAGLVELVEINHVHRRAEFQIIISRNIRGKGLATRAAKLAMDYGFTVPISISCI